MGEFDNTPTEVLRAQLREFIEQQQPKKPGPPLPEGLEPGNRTPAQMEKVSENWISYVLSKPHMIWTESEKRGVRQACVRLLEDR